MSQVHHELAALTADLQAWLEWAQLTGSEVLPRERVEPLKAAPIAASSTPRPKPAVDPSQPVATQATRANEAAPVPSELKPTPPVSARASKTSARWQALMDAPTTHTVAGPRDARLLIIRGAGSSSDAEVMLDRMLTNVLKLGRQQVAVVDLVRDSRSPADIGAGLRADLSTFSPQVALVMGTFAAKALLGEEASVPAQRGRWQSIEGIGELRVTHHPDGLIALAARGNGEAKRETFEDLKALAERLS